MALKIFYYVPAPGKRVALYRDWLVMFICRPFFSGVILHWHAVAGQMAGNRHECAGPGLHLSTVQKCQHRHRLL